MIDIIIPAYNAQDKIKTTLYSIAFQDNSELANVYIVNYGSFNYSDIVKDFSLLINIKEIKINNSSLSLAKQYGIDNSNSPYIMFMDPEDTFANCFSLDRLHTSIDRGIYDLISSKFFSYDNNTFVKEYTFDKKTVYGKVYTRSFLRDKKICFDNNIDNDCYFNQLCYLLKSNTHECCFETYLNRHIDKVDIRNNFDNIDKNITKIYYILDKIIKENVSSNTIGSYAYSCLIDIYFYYLSNDKESKKVFNYAKKILDIYNQNKIVKEDRVNIYYDKYKEYIEILDKDKWLFPKKTFDDFLKYIDEGK